MFRTPGFLYAVDLDPGRAPRRIKLGWALDPARRLIQHQKQRACPAAILLQQWPCDKAWETFVIVAATAEGCRRRGYAHEEFDVTDVAAVLERIDALAATHDLAMPPERHGYQMADAAGLHDWWKTVFRPVPVMGLPTLQAD